MKATSRAEDRPVLAFIESGAAERFFERWGFTVLGETPGID